MQEGQPSRTAQRVALLRAAHQRADHPVVFTDPLAERIVERTALEELLNQAPAAGLDAPQMRGLRAFVVARARYAQERIDAAVARGVTQIVILGAGLDTTAYRSAHPGVTFFEVDHPATQAWKRARLQSAGILAPGRVVYVPVDFERRTVDDALREAGMAAAPAFFSWLGVTPYLEAQQVRSMLSGIAAYPAGSEVVFDYRRSPESMNPLEARIDREMRQRVAAIGEPFRSGFDPSALEAELRAMGFGRTESLGQTEINARYFSGRSDKLAVGSLSRFMRARV